MLLTTEQGTRVVAVGAIARAVSDEPLTPVPHHFVDEIARGCSTRAISRPSTSGRPEATYRGRPAPAVRAQASKSSPSRSGISSTGGRTGGSPLSASRTVTRTGTGGIESRPMTRSSHAEK